MHFVFIKLQQLMSMLCHFKNSNIKKEEKNTFKCQIDSFTLVKKITLLFHLEIVFVNISYVNENQ